MIPCRRLGTDDREHAVRRVIEGVKRDTERLAAHLQSGVSPPMFQPNID